MDYSSQEPNFRDDFNYPSLNRKDLMSLDTIKDKDFPKKKINQINSKRNWSINLYNLDIDKSYPKRTDNYLNKVDFINKIDDIEKARPNRERRLIKPNYILNVRDIEKAYPKKDRFFHGKNYYIQNKENKILTPNNNMNINLSEILNENSKQQKNREFNNANSFRNNYFFKNRYMINNNSNDNNKNSNYNDRYNNHNDNPNDNKTNKIYEYNNKYNLNHYNKNHYQWNDNNNKINQSQNILNKNFNIYNRNLHNDINMSNNRRLSNSTKEILTKPLDTLHIIQNQRDYKDSIHDVFNNFNEFVNNEKPDSYLLNHHHDLIIGNPNKDNRLDMIMDKSNKLLSYDFSQKINLNENKKNKFDFLNTPDSVRINRQIPLEIKNQGLEKLYKELDDYKPKTYEQHLDLFTHNF